MLSLPSPSLDRKISSDPSSIRYINSIPEPTHLRAVEEEEAPAYDASPRHTGAAWMSDREALRTIGGTLGASALAVYIILETYAGPDGTCYPSVETIADNAGLSVRQTQRQLNALVQHGYITKSERTNKFGRHTGNLYTLPYHPQKPQKNGGDIVGDIPHDMTGDIVGDKPPVENVTRSSSEVVESSEEVTTPPRKKAAPVMSPELVEAFDSFWKAWPRKEARKDALKAWTEVVKDSDTASLVMAQFRDECRDKNWEQDAKTNRRTYIPYPATWLRRENWVGREVPRAPEQMTERERLQAEFDALNNGSTALYGHDRVRRLSELYHQLQALA